MNYDANNILNEKFNINLDCAVDTCPICGAKISPIYLSHHVEYFNEMATYYAICQCPNNSCKEIFFAKYSGEYQFTSFQQNNAEYEFIIDKTESFPYLFSKDNFDTFIHELSPEFIEVYKQATIAQKTGLTKICGAGYRQAFEILIKDFAIKLYPEKENDIKQDSKVTNVIANRLPNDSAFDEIKEIALRAWWLGCDSTHYYKQYEEHDVEDLINCIEITTSSISFYLKRQHYKQTVKKINP